MVDEFQDTNALQCELIDLLAAEPDAAGRGAAKDVFYVGDEFQSIYGFRHADVDVFRQRRELAATRLPLSENYRSRPEVLAAVNYLFAGAFGDAYQRCRHHGVSDPVFAPAELLVTDRAPTASRASTGGGRRRGTPGGSASSSERRGDAREIVCSRRRDGRRVVRGGLGALGLPTFRATGRRHLASSRSSTCSCTAGAAQPLRRRGARRRAEFAVRRRLERRARADWWQVGRRRLHRDRARAAGGLAPEDERLVRLSSATSGSPPLRPLERRASSLSRSTTRPAVLARWDGLATPTCAS
jgi:hypothetical protein